MGELRSLEVNVISAKDLNDITLFTKMDVYAFVSISGDPQPKQKTKIDRVNGKDPVWNFTARFTVDVSSLRRHSQATLDFLLRCDRVLGDQDIGEVHVPLSELVMSVGKPGQFVSYQVMKPSGKAKGVLNISYKFGDVLNPPEVKPSVGFGSVAMAATYPHVPPTYQKPNPVLQYPPVAAAPAAGMDYGYPPPPLQQQLVAGYMYPPPPQQQASLYPSAPPQFECYPLPQPAQYGGYPPPPEPNYGGYPPPPKPDYGGYSPPPNSPFQYGGGFPPQSQPDYGGYPPQPQPDYGGYPPMLHQQQGHGYPPPPQPGYVYPHSEPGNGYPSGQQGYGSINR